MRRFSFVIITEDFNKRVFVPELSKDEEKSLVQEVCQNTKSLEFGQETTEQKTETRGTRHARETFPPRLARRVYFVHSLIFPQHRRLLVV